MSDRRGGADSFEALLAPWQSKEDPLAAEYQRAEQAVAEELSPWLSADAGPMDKIVQLKRCIHAYAEFVESPNGARYLKEACAAMRDLENKHAKLLDEETNLGQWLARTTARAALVDMVGEILGLK